MRSGDGGADFDYGTRLPGQATLWLTSYGWARTDPADIRASMATPHQRRAARLSRPITDAVWRRNRGNPRPSACCVRSGKVRT